MTEQERRAPRLGPRPLPLHLALAAAAQATSRAALPLLRSGSLPWRPGLAPRAEGLVRALDGVSPERFEEAVDEAARCRFGAFLTGLEGYRHHPYRRPDGGEPVLWREGATRLIDYGLPGADGPALFVVPSLVNRAYILDLIGGHSLLRWMAEAGFRVFLVDWGAPGAAERGFTLTDYVAGRLDRAFAAAREAAGAPVSVVGYCMGGMLALALAQRRPADIGRLALLATPWDFHAEGPALGRAAAQAAQPLLPLWDASGVMPVDAIQAMFTGLDPCLALRKFSAFAQTPPDSEQAKLFVALEDWLNDGIPLTAPVARECLIGWYGGNTPALGRWRIDGQPVEPRALSSPALVVVPDGDRIVPPASARALASALPRATVLTPAAGHIGMVVGRARRALWQALGEWLSASS